MAFSWALFREFFLTTLVKIAPPHFWRFFIDTLSPFWKELRESRDLVDVIHNTSVEIFESKKKAIAQGDENQTGAGKDIMSILSQLFYLHPVYFVYYLVHPQCELMRVRLRQTTCLMLIFSDK